MATGSRSRSMRRAAAGTVPPSGCTATARGRGRAGGWGSCARRWRRWAGWSRWGKRLRFACGNDHRLACRRVFLEACKLASGTELAARPLSVEDRKSGRTVRAVGLGGGAYRLEADGEGEATRARLEATIANGLVKLAEMGRGPGGAVEVAFACGRAHDAIVGLLLPRALNVRAALREQEAT